MKTYCLNCGHGYSGTTCPKCGTTMNSSRNTSRDNDAWTYFERDGKNWSDTTEPAVKESSPKASGTRDASRRPPAARKTPSAATGRTNLQFVIGLGMVLLIFIVPNIMRNAGSSSVEEWEDVIYYDDDEYYDEDFYHN